MGTVRREGGVPDRKAAGRNPSSRSYFDLGVRYFLAGKAEQSVEAFSKAVEADPNYADAYFNLGNALLLLNRSQDAVKAYERALALRPKDGEAYNNLGRAYYAQGSYKKAAENFLRSISIFPDWADPYYRLSETYERLGDTRAAGRYRVKATSLSPKAATRASAPPPPPRRPAEGNASPAVSREQGGGADAGHAARATKPVAGDGRRVAEARAKVRREEAKNYYKLGVKHGRAKRYEEAIEAFQQAVKLDPGYADAYYGLGRVYADSGRWREALESYQQVLRLDPKDEETVYRLGQAYAKLRAEPQSHTEAGGGAPPGAGVEPTEKGAEPDPKNSAHESPPAAGSGSAETPPAPGAEGAKVAAAASPADDRTHTYRVGPGDVLDVRLLNAPTDASAPTLYTVTAGGLLDYPLAGGPVKVAGATVEEIAAMISAALKRLGLDKQSEVAVSVRDYASHNVIVSGLVREPGTKVLQREAVPLYVILADAQPSPEAEQVQVSGPSGTKAVVDLDDTRALDMLITPGDVVTVQKRIEQFFYIGGKVDAPGQKAFRPGMTLTQAILAAGGKLSRGGRVQLLRQSGRGYLTTTVYKLEDVTSGKVPDIRLQPDDRLEVIR